MQNEERRNIQTPLPTEPKKHPFEFIAHEFAVSAVDNSKKIQKLGKSQQTIWDYLESQGESGVMPSPQKLLDLLSLKSTSSMGGHITRIQRVGLIERLLRKNEHFEAALEPRTDATTYDACLDFIRVADFGQITTGQKNVDRIYTRIFRDVPRHALPPTKNENDFFIAKMKNENLTRAYGITAADTLIFNRRLPDDIYKGVFVLTKSNRGELSIKYLNHRKKLLYSVKPKKKKNFSLDQIDLGTRCIPADKVIVIGYLHVVPLLPTDSRRNAVTVYEEAQSDMDTPNTEDMQDGGHGKDTSPSVTRSVGEERGKLDAQSGETESDTHAQINESAGRKDESDASTGGADTPGWGVKFEKFYEREHQAFFKRLDELTRPVRVNDRVFNQIFGEGTVIEVYTDFRNRTYPTVTFDNFKNVGELNKLTLPWNRFTRITPFSQPHAPGMLDAFMPAGARTALHTAKTAALATDFEAVPIDSTESIL